MRNIGDYLPKPTLPSSQKPKVNTGELRVAEPREFKPVLDQVRVGLEMPEILNGPGIPLGVLDGKSRLAEYRDLSPVKLETGITFDKDGKPQIEDVPHPESTPENPVLWDPFEFMPRFVFEKGEDALPVSPSFDGDADVNNDAPSTPNGTDGHYRDGIIGGNQALSGGFAVSKKGEYTVLTYSFYYPTNKAGSYHGKDWSHAQVYLKPNEKTGKLEPEYVYTSWHHGGILTPWEDLKKDKDGKPVLEVQLGSHAVAPLGKNAKVPEDAFQIDGNGQAYLNGKAVNHQLTWDTFQGNVKNAIKLEPDTDAFTARMITMRYGRVAFDPIMPEVFFKEGGMTKAVLEKVDPYLDKITDPLEKAVDAVADTAKDLGNKAKDLGNKALDGLSKGVKSLWGAITG